MLDTTGAGDSFSAGFLYGLIKGLTLRRCARVGCLAGACAVQCVGADLSVSDWQWLHRHMHSQLAAAVIDSTAQDIYRELLEAYALVERIGAGVVYFGSARC